MLDMEGFLLTAIGVLVKDFVRCFGSCFGGNGGRSQPHAGALTLLFSEFVRVVVTRTLLLPFIASWLMPFVLSSSCELFRAGNGGGFFRLGSGGGPLGVFATAGVAVVLVVFVLGILKDFCLTIGLCVGKSGLGRADGNGTSPGIRPT